MVWLLGCVMAYLEGGGCFLMNDAEYLQKLIIIIIIVLRR